MTGAVRRLNEAGRVELMLCVLPWLAASGGAPLAEVAERFGADPEQLRNDLLKVFYEVEPEVGADTMVEVDIDEDDDQFVSVRLPGSFEEPPRLDHNEALLLLAAGTAMAGERGEDLALGPALAKLAAALGEGSESALQVDLGGGDPLVRELLRSAVRERCRVEMKYFSWSSDEVTERVVDPWALRSVQGNWYLSGYCNDRAAVRQFRLDRVLAAAKVGSPGAFEIPEEIEPPDDRFSVGARRITLRIPTDGAWVVDSYPVESWREDGGTVETTLAIHNDVWLDRLLLRLPQSSTAIDSETGEDLLDRRAGAARRILDRYGAGRGAATGDR